MKRLSDLEYLQLNKFQAFLYRLKIFFCSIPGWIWGLCLALWGVLKKFGLKIWGGLVDIGTTFKKGNWAVKLSYLIFGFGNLFYGQIGRGLLFLFFEVMFIGYMIIPNGGLYWLGKCNWFQTGMTIGTAQGHKQYNELYDTYVWVEGDDSVRVMLYALLTVIFIIAFIWTWRLQIKQCRICMDITASGKKVKSGKDDLRSMVDDQFHKTMLALPLTGILLFTVLPIIYMVLVAFTTYDASNDGYSKLFGWAGFENFGGLFETGYGGMGPAFREILGWTLMWSFFATFSTYFLGMFVAIMINKKGIKLKKLWRTVLVMTIAIPQFVSLLYVRQLFDSSGIIGEALIDWGWLPESMVAKNQLSLWANPTSAKILLIVVNIWIGIPYVMLQATGILMNIPADLYESSRVDGANAWQQYTRITLPYMLFVTGPALLTSFVGNLNNFNVIYLLSGGGPTNTDLGSVGGAVVGHTDLLVTWLFKMTMGSTEARYNMASVLGILIFAVCAILSLVVYNVIPSTKNEEDFK